MKGLPFLIILVAVLGMACFTGSAFNPLDVDNDGDGYSEFDGDCNDDDSTIVPGQKEICDGLDNDCDGKIDIVDPDLVESTKSFFYWDEDGDGFGRSEVHVVDCIAPQHYVANDFDCDDTRSSVYPNASETCDGLDSDCDGKIPQDEKDLDNDGYLSCNDDCDDQDSDIHPYSPEIPGDNIDQDCDGFDECYLDSDDDGYGGITTVETSPGVDCDTIDGLSSIGQDCDDEDAAVSPGQTEVCDGIDRDCNGVPDDGEEIEGCQLYYRDLDGDGFGNQSKCLCSAQANYTGNQGGDCYEQNSEVNPSQTLFFSIQRGDGSYDYDCNENEEMEFSQTASSCGQCDYFQGGNTGMWADYQAPSCGQTASWCPNCDYATYHSCQCLIVNNTAYTSKTQTCR